MVETIWQDVRYAVRGLRRTPGFTAAVVLTLALGIGAITAIFSLLEAALLRPLPVAAPAELYFAAHGQRDRPRTDSNYPYFERLKARGDVFAGVTAYTGRFVKVQIGDMTEVTNGQFVSGNYHAVLGVRMALGRGFVAESDTAGAGVMFAVISDRYWTRRFARDPDVLGRTIVVDRHPLSIVGVTATGFEGLTPGYPRDITIPLAVLTVDEPDFLTTHENWTSMPIVGRLRPGVTEAQAAAGVESVFHQYLLEPPNQWYRPGSQLPTSFLIRADRGEGNLRRQYSDALGVLMAMVAVVLLIACVNVASLFLARATTRAKEVAIRMAVGARRIRLLRQFIVESVLLASTGGAVGLLIAVWGARTIAATFDVGRFPIELDVRLNPTVLAFTAGTSLLTAMVFGLLPAFRATRLPLASVLKPGAVTTSGPLGRLSGRHILVIGQIALCVLLVSGAGLLVRTLRNLESLGGGFDRENILMFTLDASRTTFPVEGLPGFCEELIGLLRARGAITSGSCSASVPVDTRGNARRVIVPGASNSEALVHANLVTPEYFRTFGIPLVRGRTFTALDSTSAPQVAVVNESLARLYFGSDNPIGRTIRFGTDTAEPMTIVGLVRDVIWRSLREAPPHTVYTPLSQASEPESSTYVSVRTVQNPANLATSIRQDVSSLNSDIVVDYVRTMNQQIGFALVRERVMAMLSTWFGALALLLACIGLYGVMTYEVSQRLRELSIRIALGAHPARLLRHVLVRALVVAVFGILIGLAVTSAATRLLASLLFDLSPRDPFTLIAATVLLATTTLAAGYLPARRAARLDPVTVLRAE